MPVILLVLMLFSWPAFAESDAEGGSVTGLPIPRFVSLKNGEVNVRTGPGDNHPIAWVYKRKGLPVEITAEFEQWRRIRDKDGEGGWVHKSMVSSKRRAIFTAAATLSENENGGNAVINAGAGVQADMLKCSLSSCLLDIENHKGWTEKKNIWGVYASEKYEK